MRKALLGLLLLLAPARADDVLLKGGTRLSGVVLRRDADGVRLLTAEGSEIRVAAADLLSVIRDPDAPKAGTWVRFKRGEGYGGKLQVALVHLVRDDGKGPRVDLLSAVHIADAAYWGEVRRLLESAEVVLYEMVRPKGASVRQVLERKKKSTNPVSALQRKLARWFDLQFQLDVINYERPHFVHADLEIGRMPKEGERGGDLPKALKPLQAMLEMAGPVLDQAMGDDNDPKALKLRRQYKNVSARMLGTLGSNAAVLFGPRLKSALLTQRNEIVVQKLAGLKKRHADATIFYGAAHMADIEARLEKSGYRRAGGRWLTAWDVPD